MPSAYPLCVDESLISAYQRDGFVLTPGLFAAGQLETCTRAVDAEVARRTSDDTRRLAEKSIYEQSFVQCMRLWETCEAVKPLTCDPALAAVAAQLMGVDRVRLWQDQALYKEPGGRETDAHQDQTFWPVGDVPLISAWIPFDAVTEHNGAMAYVPGSHKAGALKVVDITHSTTPYEILDDPELAGREPRSVSAPAGTVIWHNGFTVHQAAANNSAATRRVFTIVYIADGYRRAKAWPVFPLDRAGVQVGEVMRGEGMPLLWPPGEEPLTVPERVGIPVGPQYRL